MKIEHKSLTTSKGVADIYKLTNASGASVVLSSIGAGIVEVKVPDVHHAISNVALGYKNLEDYLYDGPCMGKTPGRYANRIGRGRFSIDGVDYQLAINNGPNALHGGPEGFQNQLWKSAIVGNNVVFMLSSPDGDEGYPGNLAVEVRYNWSEDNVLTVKYHATTDRATVVNLTNHSYWNLNGENVDDAMAQMLTLDADYYLVTDPNLCPTGEVAPVKSTPMDFRTEKSPAGDLHKEFPALKYGKGFDNCWLINNASKGKLRKAASLRSITSGRRLNVYTDQPAVQVYTGNWLKGSPQSISGGEYEDYAGVAIECQGCPDAPNKPDFPSQLLRPGEVYDRTIVFSFTTEGEM